MKISFPSGLQKSNRGHSKETNLKPGLLSLFSVVANFCVGRMTLLSWMPGAVLWADQKDRVGTPVVCVGGVGKLGRNEKGI